MKYGSTSIGFFLIDGIDLVGVSTALSDGVEALTEDAGGLNAVWPEPLPIGIKRAQLTQEGFFDDVAGGAHDAFNELQGTSRIVCFGYEGNTVGKGFKGYAGTYAGTYIRIAQRNQLMRANARYTISGAADEGVILHQLLAEASASGNTEGADSVDNGASTANGGAGYLQVTAITLSGRPSVTIKLRHSADDITYADLATFAAVSAAPAKERVTIAGTINRHTAVSWAFGGSGGSPSVTFMAGLARD